jgi:hypothetical protein
VQHRHIQYREDYYKNPQVREMGHGRDLFALHRNGQTFPVEVSLSHYAINGTRLSLHLLLISPFEKTGERSA